jgi:hypothetical protein
MMSPKGHVESPFFHTRPDRLDADEFDIVTARVLEAPCQQAAAAERSAMPSDGRPGLAA